MYMCIYVYMSICIYVRSVGNLDGFDDDLLCTREYGRLVNVLRYSEQNKDYMRMKALASCLEPKCARDASISCYIHKEQNKV